MTYYERIGVGYAERRRPDPRIESRIYDALGAASRVGVHASAFVLSNGQLSPVPPQLRSAAFDSGAALNQRNRCPGAAEHRNPDGTNPWQPPGVSCDPNQVLPGK